MVRRAAALLRKDAAAFVCVCLEREGVPQVLSIGTRNVFALNNLGRIWEVNGRWIPSRHPCVTSEHRNPSIFNTLISVCVVRNLRYRFAQAFPGLASIRKETRMKVARLLGFLLAALILIPMAHADGNPVTMVFQDVNGANDGQYYVSPYTGTMGPQTVTLFCDDVLNEVNFGQTWQANVTNLGSAIQNHDFSQTRYGGVTSSLVYNNAAQTYQEAAWLTTQFGSNTSNYKDLQYALWFLMNPNLTKYDTAAAQSWLDMAGADYTSIDPNNFLIITNTSSANNPLALTGQVQEFLVVTPEPGTFAMVACAMLALVITLFRRGLLSA